MLNDQESGSLTRTSLKTLALVVIIILSITVLTKWQAATEATSTSYILDGSSNHGSYREDSSIIKDGEIIFESLDCAFHDSIRSKISQLHEGISERWNISHFPNFRTTMNIPASSWTLQKAKFIRLLLEANANHVLKDTASVASFGLSFVVGFSGSSVTAGHDNYFKEAFPQVFHDSMAPIFQAMEVPFVVRNHALGNNPCYPYDACIAAHLGDDLDILAWEQSLNCGRWSPPVDTFSRQASFMKKKPTLLYITSGGPTWTRQDCAAMNITTSGDRDAMSAAEREISGRSTHENAEVNAFLQQFTFLRDSDGAYLASRFASLAPMAQSIFGIADYKCLGPYNASFCEKTPGGGAVHHPGKLMHLFRGQNLAYFYLAILAEAAQEVQQLVCPRPEVAAAAVQTAQVAANVPSVDVAVAQQKQGSARSLAEDAGNGIQQLEKPELSSDSNSDSPKSEIRKSEARIDLLAGKWGRGRVYPRSASVVRALVDRARNSRNLAAPSAASVNADTSLPLRPAKSAMSATSVYQAIAGVLNMSLPVVPAGVLHSAQPASGIISTKALYRFVREYVHQIQAAPLPPVPNHYNISEIAHEPLCHTNYEPRMKNALTDIIIPAHSNWTYDLSFLDKAAVEKSIAKGYGYIDRKNIFTSSGVNSTLTLRVRNDVPARLWLCEVPKGFAVYPSWAADLVDGADVYIRYNYTPSAAASAGPTSTTQGGNGTLPSQVYIPPDLSKMEKIDLKTWYIQCARTSEVRPGTHMLTLVQKSDKKVNLGYVVSWL